MQRFRFTPTEQRVVVFVLAAFALGLATKCYRDAHPSPVPSQPSPGRARLRNASRAEPPASAETTADSPGPRNVTTPRKRARKSKRTEKHNLSDPVLDHEHQQQQENE